VKRRSSLKNHPTQTDRIVGLLRERSPNWVPLTEILALQISQYAARIYQARHQWGLNIESRVETTRGKKHSWFRLVESSGPRLLAPNTSAPDVASVPDSFPEFGKLAPERYPD